MRFCRYAVAMACAFIYAAPLVHASDIIERTITRADWPEYVNGANLAALPQLQQVLARFDERSGTRIEIRFPGGADGERWGETLQQWFIAYGVPLDYLDMAPGSGGPDRLVVLLVSR